MFSLNHINVPVYSTFRPYRDRQKLLTEYDAILLRHIARDLLHALSHKHENTWTAFVEPVVSTGGNSSIAP